MGILAALGSPLRHELERMAAPPRRCVIMVGVPGVGKSLWAQQLALTALSLGRQVTLLQWDVVRGPLEKPPYDREFPERDGVTHPAIRLAVNSWVRGAIDRWDATASEDAILVGETSLTQERLGNLARASEDRVESLLASDRTLFVIPTPTVALRSRIAAARQKDSDAPRHEHDRSSAAMNVLEHHWRELVAVAHPTVSLLTSFDPGLYVDIYSRVLCERHVSRLDIDQEFDVASSVFELPQSVTRLEIESSMIESLIAPFRGVDADVLEKHIPFLPSVRA